MSMPRSRRGAVFGPLIALQPSQRRDLYKMGDKSEVLCRQTLSVLALPLSASCKVAKIRIDVDLPAPFGPSRPRDGATEC